MSRELLVPLLPCLQAAQQSTDHSGEATGMHAVHHPSLPPRGRVEWKGGHGPAIRKGQFAAKEDPGTVPKQDTDRAAQGQEKQCSTP